MILEEFDKNKSAVINAFDYIMLSYMPTDMKVKINHNDVMSKWIVLSLTPILGALSLRISKEQYIYSYYIANIIIQIILFLGNILLIYVNLKNNL